MFLVNMLFFKERDIQVQMSQGWTWVGMVRDGTKAKKIHRS
jgi:hypothetical protein